MIFHGRYVAYSAETLDQVRRHEHRGQTAARGALAAAWDIGRVHVECGNGG
jgi:hypothetical protein